MEHRNGDNTARFLLELRQLRDGAGLGHAELAARAHYPYDSIRAAEVGPSLPDLPVLSAFVRACGGTAEEWEERWRSLKRSPSLPVAAARQSGRSDASAAGARINATAQAGGDSPDPSVIKAALNRVAEEMASPGAPAPPTVAQPLPRLPRPPSLPLPSNRPAAEDSRPAGWDPIRVSSAWPALKFTPTTADPTRAHPLPTFTSDTRAPWGTVPRAGDPAAEAAPNAGGSSAAGTRAVADSGAAAPGGTAPGWGAAPPYPVREGRLSTRTKVVAVAVAALILLAALLAVFA